MTEVLLLGRRAVREIARYPEATIPALFIPLFFLAVNIGQVSEDLPGHHAVPRRPGLRRLPAAGLADVRGGHRQLRPGARDRDRRTATSTSCSPRPIRRSSIIFGRLAADLVRGLLGSTVVLLAGLAFGAHMESGVLGALVLVVLAALFGVGYAGFGILVALRTRNVQATNTSFLLFFPLLFLTPNFVPFDRLTPVMEALARANPVSYVIEGLRSLVIEGWDLDKLAACVGVIVGAGRACSPRCRCGRSRRTTAETAVRQVVGRRSSTRLTIGSYLPIVGSMPRRKPGTLLPLETEILEAALGMRGLGAGHLPRIRPCPDHAGAGRVPFSDGPRNPVQGPEPARGVRSAHLKLGGRGGRRGATAPATVRAHRAGSPCGPASPGRQGG